MKKEYIFKSQNPAATLESLTAFIYMLLAEDKESFCYYHNLAAHDKEGASIWYNIHKYDGVKIR